MPHTKITQTFVEGLPFQDSTDWYHDTELAGFNLSVGRRSKTYYAAAENDGRFMRVKIGRADVTKANEARAVARDILLPEIRRGVDPRSRYFDDAGDTAYARIMRGIRMSDEKADLALRGRRKKDADKVTVGYVWGMYEEYHLARLIEDQGPEKANRAKKHIAEQRRLLGVPRSISRTDHPPQPRTGRTAGGSAPSRASHRSFAIRHGGTSVARADGARLSCSSRRSRCCSTTQSPRKRCRCLSIR